MAIQLSLELTSCRHYCNSSCNTHVPPWGHKGGNRPKIIFKMSRLRWVYSYLLSQLRTDTHCNSRRNTALKYSRRNTALKYSRAHCTQLVHAHTATPHTHAYTHPPPGLSCVLASPRTSPCCTPPPPTRGTPTCDWFARNDDIGSYSPGPGRVCAMPSRTPRFVTWLCGVCIWIYQCVWCDVHVCLYCCHVLYVCTLTRSSICHPVVCDVVCVCKYQGVYDLVCI